MELRGGQYNHRVWREWGRGVVAQATEPRVGSPVDLGPEQKWWEQKRVLGTAGATLWAERVGCIDAVQD